MDNTQIWQRVGHRPRKILTIPEKVLTEDSAREPSEGGGAPPGQERDTAVSDRDGAPGPTPEPKRVELDLL